MRARWVACLAWLLATLPLGHAARAETPDPADTSPTVLTIVGLSGATLDVTAAMLAQLPATTVADPSPSGAHPATYQGPLLWAVLDRAGALSPALREQAGEAVLVSGAAGTTTLLALAEISPGFEGKSVILANRQDGQPLPDNAVALVVPGDKQTTRSVATVTRIAIVSP